MTSGYPDWTKNVQPRKTVPGSDQSMLWWAGSVNVPADTYGEIDITTVDEGKKLFLYAYDVSSLTSNNTEIGLLSGSNFVHLALMTSSDRVVQFVLPDGSIYITGGNTLKFYIANQDSGSAHIYYYNIMGVIVTE